MKVIPLLFYYFEVFIQYLFDNSFVIIVQIIRKSFLNIKIISIQPILTFLICFLTVYMNRFITFVCIKEKFPPIDVKNCWHYFTHIKLNYTEIVISFLKSVKYYVWFIDIPSAICPGDRKYKLTGRS